MRNRQVMAVIGIVVGVLIIILAMFAWAAP